jgi:recombination protein RecT
LEIGSVEGQAYLVPFKNECQLIIGYRGFSLMAWRDANITMQSECVYAKDKFIVTKGLKPSLIHEPYIDPKGDAGKRGPLIAVYAVATLPDGRQMFVVHDREEIDRRRNISQARDGKAWKEFYPAMASKGPIRQLGSQVIPQSIAPKLVEAAVMDERREAGIDVPPPELALQSASDITGAVVEAETSQGEADESSSPAVQIAEGLLQSVKQNGKLIFISVDTGDQNPLEFSTFDSGLLDTLLPLKNKQARVFYQDNTKNGKTYHNIINVEAV